MRRGLALALCFFISSLIFFAVRFPVAAQTGIPCNYFFWDFTGTPPAGVTVVTGSIAGDGIYPEDISGTWTIEVHLTCDDYLGTPRYHQLNWNTPSGWTIAPYWMRYYNDSDTLLSEHRGGSSSSGDNSFSFSSSTIDSMHTAKTIKITFHTTNSWSAFHFTNIAIYDVTLTPTPTFTPTASSTPTPTLTPTPTIVPIQDGDWSYPIALADRYELSRYSLYPYTDPSNTTSPFTGLIDDPISSDPYSYFAITEYAGSDVYAIVNGTVIAVKPMVNATDCVSGGWDGCFVFSIDTFRNVYVLYETMYQIDVQLSDSRTIRYFVQQPTVWVGKPIVAGCIIGKTLPLAIQPNPPALDGNPFGVVFVQGIEYSGDLFDLIPYLGSEPTPRDCSSRLAMECALIADPVFEGDPRWQVEPDPLGQGISRFLPGGGLQLLGTATQKINLDPLRSYSIVMNYTPTRRNAPRFFLQIGDSEPYEIYDDYSHRNTVGIPVTWTQWDTIYTPNDDDFFDIRIFTEQGQETSGIRVDYFCLFDSEPGNVQPPGACLLYNHEFDQGGTNTYWEVAAPSGPLPSIQSGLAIMYDETTIRQSLNLRPKTTGSQGYRISVLARRAGVQADDEYVNIDWEWGSFSGTITPYRSGNFQDGTDTFTVSLAQTNDLILTLDTSNSPSISTAHIDRVCITTSDGANPPGYLDPPVIEANCKACIYVPTGDITTDLAELVQWLGCMLLSLWECSVKSVMVGIWQTLVMILTAIGYLRMWLGMVFDNVALWTNGNINAVAAWAGRELWNLGTRFENALTNTISVTNIVSGGGANLGDVLLGLINGIRDVIVTLFTSIGEPIINLLSRFVDGIFGLAFAIINLIAALILLVVGLLQGFLTTSLGTIMGIFQAIVNGFAMSPVAAAPDWLIYCTDPTGATPVEGPLAYLCTGIWLMEQQFRSGPAQYFIPIFIGLSVLSLLLWGAQKLLDTIAGISQ